MTDLIQSNDLKHRLTTAIKANWQDYYQTINQLPLGHEIAHSLKLLHFTDELLNHNFDFSQSSDIERFMVGGVHDKKVSNDYPFENQLLGDMQGFASFKKLIKKDPQGLDNLLKIIPSNGPVDGWHFMQFVDAFQQLFSNNGFKQAYVFPATRLITMKRPDNFVALNKESAAIFCQALSIKPLKNTDFQRYWDDIILPIQHSSWYKCSPPEDVSQLAIYRARFALLERIICTPVVQGEGNRENSIKSLGIPSRSQQAETDILVSAAITSGEQAEGFISPQVEAPVKKQVAQPKKMTIVKKKSAKGNKNAATKLMSQYYFANKEKFGKVNMAAHRESIISKLIEGESVEEAFAEILTTIS